MPGGGKSTAGRQIAKRTQRRFVDSDAVIEARIGEPIRSFFEREGEARFRDIEAEVIGELSGAGPAVIATGGGAVLRPENRSRLHERCDVVYLRSSPEELYRRLRHDTQRPLLQVADPLARLRELYQLRDPLYRETAHFVIDTGRPTVHALVNMVLAQLQLAGILALPDAAAGEPSPPD
ncbi:MULTISPECIES: shikimate kinase [unclassified Rhizobacter]|uniref:shikimate kinase n=1 Tax=unclassified Rhizobacter TaxID=2640088 RepID=UPI0006FEEB69|nr:MULTISPECIES: shikimate kinase [unclassified Rhizobacter]KQU67026.1 shikimate kinase [Rhizobacter sp. Root29]KQV98263.1 shikimate kinase [Rhizobacter sp. Root1238]KRB02161.1 shikimate kinase [Rhizobacter sp. Root16D2]